MSSFINSHTTSEEELMSEFNHLEITNIMMPHIDIFNEIVNDNIHDNIQVIITDPYVENGYESPTPTGPPIKPPSIKRERKNAMKQYSYKRRRSSSI